MKLQYFPKNKAKIKYLFLIAFVIISSVLVVSCKRSSKKEQKASYTVEDIGYIVSTEITDNRSFVNDKYFFIPSHKIDSTNPMRFFEKRNLKQGFGFYLYSWYYVQLFKSMGYDLISKGVFMEDWQRPNYNIEFRRCLPVKIKFKYNATYMSDLVQKGYIQTYNDLKFSFQYTLVDEIQIEKLEILMPKEDDLSGNLRE